MTMRSSRTSSTISPYYGTNRRNNTSKNDDETPPALLFSLMIFVMIFLCIMTIYSYPLIEFSLAFLSQILRVKFKRWEDDILIIFFSLIGFSVSLAVPAGLSASLYFAGKYTDELRKKL